MAIVPTLLYIYSISKLGNPPGNWDVGSTVGSYIGLLFLVLCYTSIGIFSSIQTSNQIVAFLLGVLLCFVFYFSYEVISRSAFDFSHFRMKYHYDGVAR